MLRGISVPHFFLLLLAGTAVSRAPSESCESLKKRLMQSFQEQARRQFVSASKARALSCEAIGKSDLNDVQFKDCLAQILDENEILEINGDRPRSWCYTEFWEEADQDSNSKVSSVEFLNWQKNGVLDLLLSASELEDRADEKESLSTSNRTVKNEEPNVKASGVKVQIGDVEFQLSSRQAESLADVTAALQDGNPLEAFVQLYRLLAMSVIRGFNTNILIPLSDVMQTLVQRTIPRISSQAMSILSGVIFGGEQAIAAASQTTASAISGLIRATVDNNPSDMTNRIYDTIAGLVSDLTPIRRTTVEQVVSLLRSLADRDENASGTSDDVINTLSALLSDVGVGESTRRAVLNLAQAIVAESPGAILNEISSVFNDVLGSVSTLGTQAAGSLSTIVRALAEGDRQEAVMQTSHLYRLVSRETSACQNEYLVTSVNPTRD